MRVLTPAQMREADAAAVTRAGADALMRAAGRRIAERVVVNAPRGRVAAFAGPGNNGGDAFAALAELSPSYERVVYAAQAERVSQARREAEARAIASGVLVRPLPQSLTEARDALAGVAVALDALLGTGARLPLPAAFAPAVTALNESGACVLAVDVPSGVDALSGAVAQPAVRATETVTLGAVKPGLLLEPARACVGTLVCADIGIAPEILEGFPQTFAALDDASFAALLPRRAVDADKRTAGAPLVVAGSQQFPGAAVLCARAAARAGAGYVTVATAANATGALRAHLVEQVVVAIAETGSPEDAAGDLLDIAKRNGSIAIGPGLGLDDRTGAIVRAVIARAQLPIVADASALFHLAKNLDVARGKRIVLTPHAGEFARLSGLGTIAVGERVARLREFVARTGVTTLLKGPATLIDDGTTTHINTTGTPALATAGSGDVLTGVIATLLAQGLSPVDAARAGAYWHGLAARFCAAQRPIGTVAGDLPDALAAALS